MGLWMGGRCTGVADGEGGLLSSGWREAVWCSCGVAENG